MIVPPGHDHHHLQIYSADVVALLLCTQVHLLVAEDLSFALHPQDP